MFVNRLSPGCPHSHVVVSDDVLLFRNSAGQPRTDRLEAQTNPLGPSQPAGESAGAALTRQSPPETRMKERHNPNRRPAYPVRKSWVNTEDL